MVFRLDMGQVKRVEILKTGNLLMENFLKKMDWNWIFSYQVKPEFPGGMAFYDFLEKI
jgi:hypothetical protein